MGFFTTLAIYGTIWSIGKFVEWMTPPEPGDQMEVKLPLTEEGVPLAICYGQTRLDKPFLLWWGDVHFKDITSYEQDDMFIGLDLSLGIGVANMNIWRIGAGDVTIWDGTGAWDGLGAPFDPVDGSYNIVGPVTNPVGYQPINPFGVFGEENSYGFFSSGGFLPSTFRDGRGIRWYPGDFYQLKNTYVASVTSPNTTSGYRGISHVVFQSPQVGFGPQIPPFNFDCGGFPDALNGEPTRVIGGNEANPAEVIYDLLTQPWGRAGLDISLFDTASFTLAAVTLHGEGVGSGMAGTVTSSSAGLDIIREILAQIDAILYFNPFTGKVVLKLIREDYSIPGLPSFNENDLSRDGVLNFQQTMYDDLINMVRVKFSDRNSNYKQKLALVHNMAVFYGGETKLNVLEILVLIVQQL